MAAHRSSRFVTLVALLLAACVLIKSLTFVNVAPLRSTGSTALRSFEKGKVNAGVEGSVVKSKNMPKPFIEANEATNLAIQDCLEEGCSVEALMALDQKLASDEKKVTEALDAMHASQSVEYSEEGEEQVAWLKNFLDRSGSLRAQLQAVNTLKVDGDFASQLMRAAAVAFGGGRSGDYPAVGVSPYSS
eukprot:TRINITY_DN2858_c0_g1_i3.p1 TRINITY_DN2858_c0_g1~~TRINITY_DN2858_c0_g1_i3.p1  ORF type:complete len:189 (-),score=64.41 TRINITY_DN2858_c0_g1_i3:101-667(-)